MGQSAPCGSKAGAAQPGAVSKPIAAQQPAPTLVEEPSAGKQTEQQTIVEQASPTGQVSDQQGASPAPQATPKSEPPANEAAQGEPSPGGEQQEVAPAPAEAPPAEKSLKERYEDALHTISKGKPTKGSASVSDKLLLYGLFKQINEGDCKAAQPWAAQVEARSKWSAWMKNKGQSAEDAMKQYIGEVDRQVQAFGIEAPAACRGGAGADAAMSQVEEVQVDAKEAKQNAGDEGETSEAAERPQAAEIPESATAVEAQQDKSAPSSSAGEAALEDAQTKAPTEGGADKSTTQQAQENAAPRRKEKDGCC